LVPSWGRAPRRGHESGFGAMPGLSLNISFSWRLFILLLFLVAEAMCTGTPPHPSDTLSSRGHECVSQGILRLDEPFPHPGPATVHLPFCGQYQSCTCCNASHAVAIRRSISGVLVDANMSANCRKLTAEIACRPCDPSVGVGMQSTVCKSFCGEWYRACRDDFFEFDPFSGVLIPASTTSQRSLVSGRLSVLASSGAEMCSMAGLQVNAGEGALCWDGTKLPARASELCSVEGGIRRNGHSRGGAGSSTNMGASTLALMLVLFVATAYYAKQFLHRKTWSYTRNRWYCN